MQPGEIISALIIGAITAIPMYLVFGVILPWRERKLEEKRQREEQEYVAALQRAQGE